MNTYVLLDGPQVAGVRTTLPAAMRLANQTVVEGDDPLWSKWEEVPPSDTWIRAWVREGQPSYSQRIEMHQTGEPD